MRVVAFPSPFLLTSLILNVQSELTEVTTATCQYVLLPLSINTCPQIFGVLSVKAALRASNVSHTGILPVTLFANSPHCKVLVQVRESVYI